ncbi:hypothetical protein QYM36_019453, partial [Artemia franciscana]
MFNVVLERTDLLQKSSDFTKPNDHGSFAPWRLSSCAQWFIDGDDYMDALCDAMDTAKTEISIAGWCTSHDLYMKRSKKDVNKKWRLDKILKRKAFLLYPDIVPRNRGKQLFHHAYFANHEKLVLVDQTWAFLGGIDLCYGRWDDKEHRLSDIKSPPERYWISNEYTNIKKEDFSNLNGADDPKLLGEASASSQIQSDLDALTEKLEEWQLSPNVAKCSVIHLGRQNPKYSYKMKGIDLTKSTFKKDLGVILSLDLKPKKYIGLIVRKASNTLWLLTHFLRYLDIHSKISAYTSYVRPQLEYATVMWLPYLKKDIDRIERVQKRFVKGLQGFRNLPCDEALRRLTLHKLETRRRI